LRGYLEDRGSIVKTMAMQGLADLVRQAPALRAVRSETNAIHFPLGDQRGSPSR